MVYCMITVIEISIFNLRKTLLLSSPPPKKWPPVGKKKMYKTLTFSPNKAKTSESLSPDFLSRRLIGEFLQNPGASITDF